MEWKSTFDPTEVGKAKAVYGMDGKDVC